MATLGFTDNFSNQIAIEMRNGITGVLAPISNTHVRLFKGTVPNETEMLTWVTGNERNADLLVDWTVAQLCTGTFPNATCGDISNPGNSIIRFLPNTPAERDSLGLQAGLATWLWWHAGGDYVVGNGGESWDVVFTVSGSGGSGEIKMFDPNITVGATYQLGPIEIDHLQTFTI